MRNLRILPPVYASNSWPLSSLTLNCVFGRASTTVPSISIASFLGNDRSLASEYPPCSPSHVRAPAEYPCGRLAIAATRRSGGAALSLEAIRTVDGLVAPRLEGDARLTIAAGAGGHEHFASWRSGITARGVAGWPERVGAFSLARRTTGRTATWRIIKTTTCVKLLLTACKHERRIAIAACERLVCVLHADSRKKEVVEVIASRTSYVGAPGVRSKERISKLCFQPRASIRGLVKPCLSVLLLEVFS
jgi:hypothetical protein